MNREDFTFLEKGIIYFDNGVDVVLNLLAAIGILEAKLKDNALGLHSGDGNIVIHIGRNSAADPREAHKGCVNRGNVGGIGGIRRKPSAKTLAAYVQIKGCGLGINVHAELRPILGKRDGLGRAALILINQLSATALNQAIVGTV